MTDSIFLGPAPFGYPQMLPQSGGVAPPLIMAFVGLFVESQAERWYTAVLDGREV